MTCVLNFNKLLAFTLFLDSLLLVNCKKEEIPGPKGNPEDPGGGGNSNITTSSLFPISSADWTTDSVSGLWKANVKSALFTKEIVERGSVKLFVEVSSYWWELPRVVGDTYTQFGFEEGELHLVNGDIHGGLPNEPSTHNYRLVLLSEAK